MSSNNAKQEEQNLMSASKYLEKKVSLLSTSDVRYDGELYTVDPDEQSIALKHVNCLGTQGRKHGDQAIAPSECTYEFIIFRAINIKELHLAESHHQRLDLRKIILDPLRKFNSLSSNKHSRKNGANNQRRKQTKRKVGYENINYSHHSRYAYSPDQRTKYYYHGQEPERSSRQQQEYPQYQHHQHQQHIEDYPTIPQNQVAYSKYDYYDNYYDNKPIRIHSSHSKQDYNNYYQHQQPQYDHLNHNPVHHQIDYNPQPQHVRYVNNTQQYQVYHDVYQDRRQSQYVTPRQHQPRNKGYYHQQRQGSRGYGQRRDYYQNYNNNRNRRYNNYGGRYFHQNRSVTQGSSGYSKAGTGAYLDHLRLRGTENESGFTKDFNFASAVIPAEELENQLQRLTIAENKINDNNGVRENQEILDNNDKKDNQDDENQNDTKNDAKDNNENEKEQEQKQELNTQVNTSIPARKYDPKEFFDGLETETRKSKEKPDLSQQKEVDAKTFGTVAQSYKSRHLPKRQHKYGDNRNRNRNRNNPRYNKQHYYNNGQKRNYQPKQRYNHQSSKWVPRR